MEKNKNIMADFSINDVEVLDSITCYSGFLRVESVTLRHRLYEGGWSKPISREVVHRAPGVGVLLYDPDLDKVLMVEQFRIGCIEDPNGPWKLELVAGLIDTLESAEQVAVREAKEEADTVIDRVIPVLEYFNSPGGSSEKISIFCARVDARKEEGIFGLNATSKDLNEGESEDIRTVIIDREMAEKAVREGLIDNAMAIIALQWLALNLPFVRAALKGK